MVTDVRLQKTQGSIITHEVSAIPRVWACPEWGGVGKGVQENPEAQLCLRHREGRIGRLSWLLPVPCPGHPWILENKCSGGAPEVKDVGWLEEHGKVLAKWQT